MYKFLTEGTIKLQNKFIKWMNFKSSFTWYHDIMQSIDSFTFKGIIFQYTITLVFLEVEDELESITYQPVE